MKILLVGGPRDGKRYEMSGGPITAQLNVITDRGGCSDVYNLMKTTTKTTKLVRYVYSHSTDKVRDVVCTKCGK